MANWAWELTTNLSKVFVSVQPRTAHCAQTQTLQLQLHCHNGVRDFYSTSFLKKEEEFRKSLGNDPTRKKLQVNKNVWSILRIFRRISIGV
jgi:hypothetical protein